LVCVCMIKIRNYFRTTCFSTHVLRRRNFRRSGPLHRPQSPESLLTKNILEVTVTKNMDAKDELAALLERVRLLETKAAEADTLRTQRDEEKKRADEQERLREEQTRLREEQTRLREEETRLRKEADRRATEAEAQSTSMCIPNTVLRSHSHSMQSSRSSTRRPSSHPCRRTPLGRRPRRAPTGNTTGRRSASHCRVLSRSSKSSATLHASRTSCAYRA